MSRIFYIDSENVGDAWLPLISCKEDEILVFYTNKTPYMNYESLIQLKESPKEVTFIKCFEGANALDFQLISELGFKLNGNPDSEHVIITNDTGFDAAVRYWQRKNYNVSRVPGKGCRNYVKGLMADSFSNETSIVADGTAQNLQESSPEQYEHSIQEAEQDILEAGVGESWEISEVNEAKEGIDLVTNEARMFITECEVTSNINSRNPVKKKPRKSVQTDIKFDKAEVDDIINCIGFNNLGDLHNSLELVYGEAGKEIYKVVRANNYQLDVADWNKEERFMKYCEIVLRNSDLPEKDHGEYINFLYQSEDKRRNLNSLRAVLQSRFGKDRGLKCYSTFKAHIKILNHI